MEILHFKDLEDTTSVVVNAVVQVLGECQMSIPTYLLCIFTYNIAMYWELTMLCHFKVVAD